ncbi:MAG: T9SS type A sorting domain-containing protein [Bacteroidales bacterium]|nr:T9SS type A sorting domain-containing protein [Bacteroidales bacterium]
MKFRVTILLAMILGSLASRGQDTVQPRYQSVFGDSSTTWYLYYEDYITIPDGGEEGTETRQYIAGDTVSIDGKTYNRLRYIPDLSFRGLCYLYREESLYIRESPDHSKLYFKEQLDYRPEMTFPEVLVMDLDLNVGDTLNTQGWSQLMVQGYAIEPPIMILVDSIYYTEGRKIIRTIYIGGEELFPLLFIEGIGPSLGPYYPGFIMPLSLTCYHKDGEPQYHGPKYNPNREAPCIMGDYWFGGISKEPYTNNAFEIYPNPSRNAFNIKFATAASYKVIVSTMSGKVIKMKNIHGDKIDINLSNYPIGTYFIKIIETNNATLIAKIIKI